jgi:hypothetical protein
LSVRPSQAPYDSGSVVNTNRRAACCDICQPSMVTVSHGSSTHFAAAAAEVVRASMELSPSTASATTDVAAVREPRVLGRAAPP